MADKTKSFEEELQALESIVTELEQGDVPLEKALTQFQKGIELSKSCQATLTNAEKTMTKLMNDNGQLEDFEDGKEG